MVKIGKDGLGVSQIVILLIFVFAAIVILMIYSRIRAVIVP